MTEPYQKPRFLTMLSVVCGQAPRSCADDSHYRIVESGSRSDPNGACTLAQH